MRLRLLLLAWLIVAAPALHAQVVVLDVDNRSYSCREISFTGGHSVTFSDLQGRAVTLPCADIAEIVWPRDASRPNANLVRFEFTNGDLWLGEVSESTEAGARVKSPDLGIVEARFENLDRVVLPGGEAMIPAGQGPEELDIVFKRNKDSDRGGIESLDAQKLTLTSRLFNRQEVIPLADLAAVQFSRLQEPPAEGDRLIAILSGHRGSRVRGILKEISRTQIVLESLYGESHAVPIGAVASLYFKNGRVVFLSDLSPDKVVERPFFEVSDQLPGVDHLFPYRRDQSVAGGGKISVKGKEYRKGLGIHAYSELHFALNGKFKTFHAVAGLDDSAAPTELAQPSVRFSVWVDGRKVWESGVHLWSTPPDNVTVPVDGKGTLTLIVDFAGDGDSLDRAAWAAARLVR